MRSNGERVDKNSFLKLKDMIQLASYHMYELLSELGAYPYLHRSCYVSAFIHHVFRDRHGGTWIAGSRCR
jgi:hypothetical protein